MKTFTQDWFSHHISNWKQRLGHLKNKQITALEIGSFEGRSACWMLDNLLLHPKSVLHCVDSWCAYSDGPKNHTAMPINMSAIEPIFDKNVEGYGNRLIKHKINSQKFLAQELNKDTPLRFDLIYVDGGHEAAVALADLVLSWPLLVTGGILVFDDYKFKSSSCVIPPAVALHGFLSCNRDHRILDANLQVFLEKVALPSP